jgi:hypothetical protein
VICETRYRNIDYSTNAVRLRIPIKEVWIVSLAGYEELHFRTHWGAMYFLLDPGLAQGYQRPQYSITRSHLEGVVEGHSER